MKIEVPKFNSQPINNKVKSTSVLPNLTTKTKRCLNKQVSSDSLSHSSKREGDVGEEPKKHHDASGHWVKDWVVYCK